VQVVPVDPVSIASSSVKDVSLAIAVTVVVTVPTLIAEPTAKSVKKAVELPVNVVLDPLVLTVPEDNAKLRSPFTPIIEVGAVSATPTNPPLLIVKRSLLNA